MRAAPGLVLACAIGVCAAPAVDRAVATGTHEVGEASEGRLRTRVGTEVVDVPLAHTDVAIRVTGYLADVVVTQTFHNPYPDKIDAIYLFPLPTGAAVNGMAMTIGERRVVGSIERRDDAVEIYRRARRAGHIAALLTQERPNLFTQKVANIEPGHEIEVELHYVQSLAYDGGGYELVFPMVAPPRYVPDSARDDAVRPTLLPPTLRSSHDISLSVDIDAGLPITAVESPSHQIEARVAETTSRAAVVIAAADTIPNKDFILRYRVAGSAPEFALLSHRAGTRGSFFLMAQPPALVDGDAITPRELIFVIDSSSSMAGEPLAKAKALIDRALRGMQPDDTFQIVRFDDSVSALGSALIANKPSNIGHALAWLDQLAAGGTTEMIAGIDAALAFARDPARLRMVIFLTDGFIGNEDDILAHVANHLGDARLFSFGVGSAVNRYLLEEMAAIGRGMAAVVRPDEDTDAAVDRFYARIDKPLLTNIRIDWNGLAVTDLVPAKLPDLFAGQPLILSGHYPEPGAATITIHGRLAGRPVSFPVPASLPASDDSRPEVATVWARRRIAELSRQQIRGDAGELAAEITELALAHSLMSRYTAFVAVDSASKTGGGPGRKVVVPVEVPEGVLAYARPATDSSSGSSMGYSYSSAKAGPAHAAPAPTRSPLLLRSAGGYPGSNVGDAARPASESRRDSPPIITARMRAKLKRCYADRVKSDPKVSGSLTLRIIVGKSGAVSAVEITKSTISGHELEDCIVATARSWTFPRRDEETSINVPIVFKTH